MSKPENRRVWRYVANRKRAKLLRDRGEYIKWCITYNCWIWDRGY